MNSNCNNVDAYLIGDLSTADAVRFADHLLNCNDCSETIDQQQWIEGLLKAPVRFKLEPISQRIVEASQKSLAQRSRRQTRILVGTLATAAAIMIAVGWIKLSRQASDELRQGSDRAGLATSEVARKNERPRATFVSYAGAIAVPVASRHPDVTVVRVYPAYHPRYETTTAALEPEAATKDSWQSFSNGG